MKQKQMILIGCLFLSLAFAVTAFGIETKSEYQVSITNLTRNQTFTPVLVIVHRAGLTLFKTGSPASTELAMLAEGGDTAPLSDLIQNDPRVDFIASTGGLLGPGETTSVVIPGMRSINNISLAAMMIPTNDAFIGLNDAVVAHGSSVTTYMLSAYDAGTEENDELCQNIPGPFGCDGTGEGYNSDDGEGFIHIHSGIHGVGDVAAHEYDWKNSVAKIVIQKK